MSALPRPDTPIAPARIAAMAADALTAELVTWPKPGLVSLVDSGSHTDMDAGTFRRSIAAITPGLRACAEAGRQGASMQRLRAIGIAAEDAMLQATGGINTHRGAIFGMGLLCAAAGALGRPGPGQHGAALLCETVRRRWGERIVRLPVAISSNGTGVLRRFGAGGARAQAASGWPVVRRVGLPALLAGRHAAPGDENAARVQAFFALMAELEDTNLLHRGGEAGLRFAQDSARAFLDAGGVAAPDWQRRACALHRVFVERRLSAGGCADLLGLVVFVDAWTGAYP